MLHVLLVVWPLLLALDQSMWIQGDLLPGVWLRSFVILPCLLGLDWFSGKSFADYPTLEVELLAWLRSASAITWGGGGWTWGENEYKDVCEILWKFCSNILVICTKCRRKSKKWWGKLAVVSYYWCCCVCVFAVGLFIVYGCHFLLGSGKNCESYSGTYGTYRANWVTRY